MVNNFTPVGSEIQVNLVPNQDGQQSDPDVTALSDGRFFVVFEDFDATTFVDIIGQFVNADGTLSGGNIVIDGSAESQFEPVVAQRPGGGALVVWIDVERIQYTIVSSTGVAGAEQTVFDDPGPGGFGELDQPDVATLSDGRSLVVAQEFHADGDLVFRFIDPDGNAAGIREILADGPGSQSRPAVASVGNNALVAYQDGVGTGASIHARFHDGSGFAADLTIAGGLEGAFDPDVAALTDGRFVVVWEDRSLGMIRGRLVSPTGVPLGTDFAVSLTGFDFTARVAALPDGGFIVTWTNEATAIEGGDDSDAVVARRFDATGAPAGDLFLVNTSDPETDQLRPAVAANGTGQAFIAWEDLHGFAGEDSHPRGIRGHGFVVTTDIVNGTGGDDTIATYSLAETINGLGGDDTIDAFAGNDVVNGGAGFDELKGGDGDDQLFGGGGDDLLKGEGGKDLLVGGRGSDILAGGAGDDTFDFNKVAESRSGDNHDLIKGFKHAQHDRIDRRTIDADATAGGNQAFDLIGAATFSDTAGELRFAGGLLQGDINGDGIADLEVKVTGLGAAANSDFVL